MKRNYLILILYFIGVLLIPGVLGFFISFIPWYEQPELENSVKVNGLVLLEQKFKASENNLAAIGFTVKNPSLVNKKDLIFSLFDANGDLIREQIVNGQIIDDGKLLRIKFPKVTDSSNQELTFSLSSPQSSSADSLEIYLAKVFKQNYNGLLINGQKVEENIAFVPYYSPENRLETSLNIYKDWFGKFIKDPGFLISYLILICSLVFYLVYLSKKPS